MAKKLNESRSSKPCTSRGEGTREKLLKAATDLMWLHGYGSVTIDQICEKAGVLKGSFYHFFESKMDLTVEAIDSHWKTRQVDLDRIFSANLPPLARLSVYFENAYQRQTLRREETGHVMGCLYFCLGAEVTKHGTPIAEKLQEIIRSYCRYFESVLRDAQKDGSLRVRSPAASAKVMFSYIEGCMTQARIRNDLDIVKTMGESVMAVLRAQEQEAIAAGADERVLSTR